MITKVVFVDLRWRDWMDEKRKSLFIHFLSFFCVDHLSENFSGFVSSIDGTVKEEEMMTAEEMIMNIRVFFLLLRFQFRLLSYPIPLQGLSRKSFSVCVPYSCSYRSLSSGATTNDAKRFESSSLWRKLSNSSLPSFCVCARGKKFFFFMYVTRLGAENSYFVSQFFFLPSLTIQTHREERNKAFFFLFFFLSPANLRLKSLSPSWVSSSSGGKEPASSL